MIPACRTGSDDFSVCLLNGVPFKYGVTTRRHTRFVQSLAYSPDGAVFASAGSDGQVYLYDGQTADDKGSFVDANSAAHDKGVFAVSFSRDGKQIATSSADRAVKLWDVESQKVVQTWKFDGDEVMQQQVVRSVALLRPGTRSPQTDLTTLALAGQHLCRRGTRLALVLRRPERPRPALVDAVSHPARSPEPGHRVGDLAPELRHVLLG